MDSLNNIIANLNIIDNDSFSLYNNIRDSILLENQTNRQYNRLLITIITLTILSYMQSKHNNSIKKNKYQICYSSIKQRKII